VRIIRGAKPHQWGNDKRGKKREKEFQQLVAASRSAGLDGLGIPKGKSGRPSLKRATKVQLVALKRVAELFYITAQEASNVLDKRSQADDENSLLRD
jgi:hypothetical protein